MTEVRLGTQGWSYPDWLGSFYRQGTRPGDYLAQYARRFSTVELDTTFYATPRPSQVESWRTRTPDDFIFSAKLPRLITHDRRFVDCGDELRRFVHVMEGLGPKLGPLLIQCPPDLTIDTWDEFAAFLNVLPPNRPFAAEFRHRSWLTPDTTALLQDHGIAWTVIDLHYLPWTPDVTAGFSYFRWLGDRRAIERYDRVQIDRQARDDEWAAIIRGIIDRVERVYGYYNNHYSGHSPESVRAMHRRLGLPLKEDQPPADEAAEPTQLDLFGA
ncbi:MAG: DUF72 domain-containing protein [Chloroflexota bacterium]